VIVKPELDLRVGAAGLTSGAASDTTPLADALDSYAATLRPLFGTEDRIRAAVASLPSTDHLSDLGLFYAVEADDDKLDDLADQLLALPDIDGAYVKPAGSPPAVAVESINDMAPTSGDAPAVTPDFTNRQGYLDAAPGGIDARHAWTVPGGRGAGVRIIDCEWGWRFTHEDLLANQGGVVAGTSSTDTNHGTAVLGEISGDRNTIGITGIAPDAVISASSFNDQNTRPRSRLPLIVSGPATSFC
jgi:hypothetical protein